MAAVPLGEECLLAIVILEDALMSIYAGRSQTRINDPCERKAVKSRYAEDVFAGDEIECQKIQPVV